MSVPPMQPESEAEFQAEQRQLAEHAARQRAEAIRARTRVELHAVRVTVRLSARREISRHFPVRSAAFE